MRDKSPAVKDQNKIILCGGERIRTSEGCNTLLAFQASALDHYATPPFRKVNYHEIETQTITLAGCAKIDRMLPETNGGRYMAARLTQARKDALLHALCTDRSLAVISDRMRLPFETVRSFAKREIARTQLQKRSRLLYAADVARRSRWNRSLLPYIDPSRITKRRIEYLTELAAGKSIAEMARELFVTPETVKSELRDLQKITGTSGRVELVVMAIRRGWIS